MNRGFSLALPLKRVVPQGSCLGRLLFTTYTSICRSRSYRATFQACIAMQMTLRCTLRLVQVYRATTRALPLVLCACECIWNLLDWLVRDRLKLNDSRNELLLIGNWQQLAKINLFSIYVRLSKSPFLVDYVIVRFQKNPRPHAAFLNRFCLSKRKSNSVLKRYHLWQDHAYSLVSKPVTYRKDLATFCYCYVLRHATFGGIVTPHAHFKK